MSLESEFAHSNAKFKEFLEKNKDKIRDMIPTNPSISADDEWNDKCYEEGVFCEEIVTK